LTTCPGGVSTPPPQPLPDAKLRNAPGDREDAGGRRGDIRRGPRRRHSEAGENDRRDGSLAVEGWRRRDDVPLVDLPGGDGRAMGGGDAWRKHRDAGKADDRNGVVAIPSDQCTSRRFMPPTA
jgi:hypothetical protein